MPADAISQLVRRIVCAVVERPAAVRIESWREPEQLTLTIHVDPVDLPLLARRGHVARSIRHLVLAASTKLGVRYKVFIAGVAPANDEW